jgi:2-dehydropantoate 2-reductase
MNILIFGSGAIGSLFGALLSDNSNVILYGRRDHIEAIKKKGLKIKGKTIFNKKINAFYNTKNIERDIDLIILTVKSYDTNRSIKIIENIINKKTIIITLQNGLDNTEKINKQFKNNKIIAGITTHGSIFDKPGKIIHTGIGETVLGEIDGNISKILKRIVKLFNESGIKTKYSNNIKKEIWIKTIINSSINPLTTIFNCKNGYLYENPILHNIVKKICAESSEVANTEGLNLKSEDMINITNKVINSTYENYSSMLQSYNKNKKTEINSINGKIIEIGKKNNIDTTINKILIFLIDK